MKRNIHPSFNQSANQAGFSLVEIMVGLVIGLLATLVIMQVMTSFEAQKSVTTGSSDAQTNGGIALFTIESELQNAGFPLMPEIKSPLSCTTLTIPNPANAPNTMPNAVIADLTTYKRISPVIISDGGSNSDVITIAYGDSLQGGAPSSITGAALGQSAVVASSFGCNNKDTVLIFNAQATTCAITTASGVTAGSPASAIPATVGLLNTTGATVAGGNLSCLGVWHVVKYGVNNGNLERSDSTPFSDPAVIIGASSPIVAGVVSLQAQYGVATGAGAPNNNQITAWVDATGVWADNALTPALRNQIKAVRIAVVARNAKKDMNAVTTPCGAPSPNGPCAWAGASAPTVDLSADADWQKYRYRVYDAIIPIRAVNWSKGFL